MDDPTRWETMTPEEFRTIRTLLGWTQAQAGDAVRRRERQVRRYEGGAQPIDPLVAKEMRRLYRRACAGLPLEE